jgi:hypothetical protein
MYVVISGRWMYISGYACARAGLSPDTRVELGENDRFIAVRVCPGVEGFRLGCCGGKKKSKALKFKARALGKIGDRIPVRIPVVWDPASGMLVGKKPEKKPDEQKPDKQTNAPENFEVYKGRRSKANE